MNKMYIIANGKAMLSIFSLIASDELITPVSVQITNFVNMVQAKNFDATQDNILTLRNKIDEIIHTKNGHERIEILCRLPIVHNYIVTLPLQSDFANYAQVALGLMEITPQQFDCLYDEIKDVQIGDFEEFLNMLENRVAELSAEC